MNFDFVRYEIFMNTYPATAAAWVDVSTWVIGSSRCQIGMGGNGPLDRVASTGTLDFTLLNTSNRFTRQHSRHMNSQPAQGAPRSGTRAQRGHAYGYIPPDA